MTRVLVLPGFENSGPQHWQSRWERSNHRFRRVEQSDWYAPQLDQWVATLDHAVHTAGEPVLLAAHSLGCVTVAHWIARGADPSPVIGALLVAPADIDTADVEPLHNFRPIPLVRIPFPTIVVAGDNDPWCTVDRSTEFAAAWGSRLVVLPGAGHVNSDSGLGDWPEGLALLAGLDL